MAFPECEPLRDALALFPSDLELKKIELFLSKYGFVLDHHKEYVATLLFTSVEYTSL